jgi:signal transduction histidine kinase
LTRVETLRSYLTRHWLDLALVVFAIIGVFESLGRGSGGPGLLGPPWVEAVATSALLLPLLARRRFPFAAPCMVWVVGAALSFVDGALVVASFAVFAAGITAACLFGGLTDVVRARVGLLIVLLGSAIVVANDPRHTADQFVTIPATFTVAWLAGFALRARAGEVAQAEERAARAEQERESAARLAVAEERARIARELHDIVAHAMSVMVLQVGAVRHRLPDTLAEDREALTAVESTGREALTEMRRLLGGDQEQDGARLSPQPGLDRLDKLMDEVGRAGLRTELRVEGEPLSLPRAIDLSAYRIIQEGLTNSLKHSGAGLASVTIRYSPRELQIEVRDDGLGSTDTDGRGHGLVGIRERVKIYGGQMSAGPGPDGGYLLGVRLPILDQPR